MCIIASYFYLKSVIWALNMNSIFASNKMQISREIRPLAALYHPPYKKVLYRAAISSFSVVAEAPLSIVSV